MTSVITLPIIKFIVCALATYRLAQLATIDHGPLGVIEATRAFLKTETSHWTQVRNASLAVTWFKFWATSMWVIFRTAYELMHCPFCIGFWFAVGTALLLAIGDPLCDFFVYCFAVAGAQSFLQEVNT